MKALLRETVDDKYLYCYFLIHCYFLGKHPNLVHWTYKVGYYLKKSNNKWKRRLTYTFLKSYASLLLFYIACPRYKIDIRLNSFSKLVFPEWKITAVAPFPDCKRQKHWTLVKNQDLTDLSSTSTSSHLNEWFKNKKFKNSHQTFPPSTFHLWPESFPANAERKTEMKYLSHASVKGISQSTFVLLFDWSGFNQTSILLLIKHKQSKWTEISKTGGQPYSECFSGQS